MLGDWFMAGNSSASGIAVGSPRLHTGLSGTDSGLSMVLSGKRVYPQKGRSLLAFLNNSHRSPENSVLCKPGVAGCSQTGT